MLLETIKRKCSCMKDISEDEFNLIWSGFIRFLSNITCWDIQGGTIEEECRTQAITLDKALCTYSCINVFPYWKNINTDTIAIELRQYTSSGMNVIPMDKSLFNYDDIADRFYINVGSILDSADSNCDRNCSNNVLVMRYVAGYDLNSTDWLDLICHYLTGYTAIANNCISVNDCASINRTAVGAVLVRKTVDTINYEWETDQESQEVFFLKLMKNYYVDYLSRFSLCGRDFDIKQNIFIGKGN